MTILERLPLPVDDRAALAQLVAHPRQPRPFTLDANNDRADWLPSVVAGVTSGAAYVVTVAADVLAFDVDAIECEPQLAVEPLAAELAKDGWPVLLAESGRPGHCHLWSVVTNPEARDWARLRAAELRLPAPRATMRPPGTPHRLGLPVTLRGSADQFAAAVRAVRDPHQSDRPGPLDWRDLLHTGLWPAGWAGDHSRSAMVWLICIGAIRAGYDLDTVRDWLADDENRGGHGYRSRLGNGGKRHADYWLTNYVWPEATEAAGHRLDVPADATEARSRINAIREAIDGHGWAGVGGATDRSILSALLSRAHARGSLTPTMSYRELAEAAPCSLRTVQRAVPRLIDAGWLLIARSGHGATDIDADGAYRETANATRWRLRPPDHPARTDHTGGTPPASTSLSVDTSRALATRASLDVCRWRGVGLNATRVLDALASGPQATAELAARLRLNRGNLRYRLLPRMAELGLIVSTGGRWVVAGDLDAALAAAADALGMTGKADEAEVRHAADRLGYLEHRERTRPQREARARAAKALDVGSSSPISSISRLPHPSKTTNDSTRWTTPRSAESRLPAIAPDGLRRGEPQVAD